MKYNSNNCSRITETVKSFPSDKAHAAALISVSLALSQTPALHTLRGHGYGASVSCGVPVYAPAFAGTHCAYSRRDGQAELTWVAGYIPRWFTRPQTVTHPSTNRAGCRVTSLIKTEALTTLSQMQCATKMHHHEHYATAMVLTPVLNQPRC